MTALSRRLLPQTATVDDMGHLRIGGVDLVELARDFGTPLFVYDEEHLRARAAEAVTALGEDGAIYATKAFLCRAMARLVHEEGMRLDVATGGELAVALAAGVPAERLVLHGNNKAVWELRAAMDAGVGRIVVDSDEEMHRIEALVDEGLGRPQVLIRINPGIDVHTHEHVQTGIGQPCLQHLKQNTILQNAAGQRDAPETSIFGDSRGSFAQGCRET